MDDPSRFQEMHRRGCDRADAKTFLFEQFLPLSNGQRSYADMDFRGKFVRDGFLRLFCQIVGHEAQLVDAVPPAAPQQPIGFMHNAALHLRELHRQHRFAIHDARASWFKSGCSRITANALLTGFMQILADIRCRALIAFNSCVASRSASDCQSCRSAEPWGKFDHVVARSDV